MKMLHPLLLRQSSRKPPRRRRHPLPRKATTARRRRRTPRRLMKMMLVLMSMLMLNLTLAVKRLQHSLVVSSASLLFLKMEVTRNAPRTSIVTPASMMPSHLLTISPGDRPCRVLKLNGPILVCLTTSPKVPPVLSPTLVRRCSTPGVT